MSTIHFVLQGKGGVGKSLVASFLAQYLASKSDKVLCADTDPVNDTFAQYKAFDAKRIEILNGDKNIDTRAFDGLVESLIGHDGDAVVDNGASTFVPLSSYLNANGVIELLQASGKQVYIHTVLTGGQAMDDTIYGLGALLKAQPAPVVVWANEFFGELAKGGKRFTDAKVFADNTDRIAGIVTIQRRNHDTFGRDLELMITRKMTFQEAMDEPDLFGLMPRQRLKMIQRDIFEQLDALRI